MTEIIVDVNTGEFKETARVWKAEVVAQFSSYDWINGDTNGDDHINFITKLKGISAQEDIAFSSFNEFSNSPFIEQIRVFYMESDAYQKWIGKTTSKAKREENKGQFERWFKENLLSYLSANMKMKFIQIEGEINNDSIFENTPLGFEKLVIFNDEMMRTTNIPMNGRDGYNIPRRADFCYEAPIKKENGRTPLSEKQRLKEQSRSTTMLRWALGSKKEGIERHQGKYHYLANYVPEVDETFILDRPEYFEFVEMFTREGFSKILLSGDPGVGKSELAEQVCARMNLPCIRIDFSGEITAEQFLWSKNYDPEKKKMVVEEGILPFAIRNGVKVVIEEFSAIPPSVAFELHRVMEKGNLYIKDNDTLIKRHPMFSIVMTDNRVGNKNQSKFFGTQPQNPALLDRIDVNIWIPYPAKKVEMKILEAKFPELYGLKLVNPATPTETSKDTLFTALINYANQIRGKYVEGLVGVTMSPRSVVKLMATFLRTGDLTKAFKLTVLNFVKGNESDLELITHLFKTSFGEKPELATKEVKEVDMTIKDKKGEIQLNFDKVIDEMFNEKVVEKVEEPELKEAQ